MSECACETNAWGNTACWGEAGIHATADELLPTEFGITSMYSWPTTFLTELYDRWI